MVAQFPQTLPANSVVGRLGIGSGPSEAVPFSKLNLALAVNSGTEISVKLFGAQGDGSTDDTASFVACYTFCVTNNIGMSIPPGTYMVGGLTWDKGVNVRGSGTSKTIFQPTLNNITVITAVGGGVTRDHITEVGHFSVTTQFTSGNTGVHFKFFNNCHVRDVAASNMDDTGILIEGGQYSIFDLLTAFNNGTNASGVGVRIVDDLSGASGGGNNHQFNTLDCYNNTVGLMVGRTGLPFPMSGNNFINPSLQNNSLCGAYILNQVTALFATTAPEGNAQGGASSATIHGETISKSSMQIVSSDIYFPNFVATDNGKFLIQSGSSVTFQESSCPGMSPDSTSVVNFRGQAGSGTSLSNVVLELSDPLSTVDLAVLDVENPATNIVDQSFPNTFPSPNAPTPSSFNCASVGFDTDPNLGLVTTATFNASPGNSSTNRVVYTSNDTNYPIAGIIYLAFLVNPSVTGTFEIACGQNSIDVGPITLTGGVWTRFFAKNLNTSGVTRTNSLNIWPLDSNGATIKLCRFICVVNPNAIQARLLSSEHRFNPRDKQGFRNIASSVPTVGTWVVGDIVWNSAPAPSGTIGWVCTTGGTPGTWKTWGSISA